MSSSPVSKGRIIIPTSQSLDMDHIGTEFGIALIFIIQCAVIGIPTPLVFSGNYTLLICILNGNIEKGKGNRHCMHKGLRIYRSLSSLFTYLGSSTTPVRWTPRNSYLLFRDLKTESSERNCLLAQNIMAMNW